MPRAMLGGVPAAALGDLADAAAGEVALPLVGLGLALAGVGALKMSAYSQVEYVKAAMLSRHVAPGGARVVQLGGSTRDLFYYPTGTLQARAGTTPALCPTRDAPCVQVTVAEEGMSSPGIWEQAGVQARVPVRPLAAGPAAALAAAAGSSADAVVALGVLPEGLEECKALLREAYRVLKPGGTLVYVQRVRGEGAAAALQPLIGGAGKIDAAALEASLTASSSWDFAQTDIAVPGRDPHAVGVAIKPLSASTAGAGAAAPASVDASAFEALMRSGKARTARAAQQEGGGGGGGFGQ
eukprot:scaffold2.g7008.t1